MSKINKHIYEKANKKFKSWLLEGEFPEVNYEEVLTRRGKESALSDVKRFLERKSPAFLKMTKDGKIIQRLFENGGYGTVLYWKKDSGIRQSGSLHKDKDKRLKQINHYLMLRNNGYNVEINEVVNGGIKEW